MSATGCLRLRCASFAAFDMQMEQMVTCYATQHYLSQLATISSCAGNVETVC